MKDPKTAGHPERGGQQSYDPELARMHARTSDPVLGTFLIGDLLVRREQERSPRDGWRAGHPDLAHHEVNIDGSAGPVVLSVFRRRDALPALIAPAVYFIHGGGMMVGDRFTGIEMLLEWVEEFDLVGVSVEYRLAPEHPDPAPVEDCYAGLVWLSENALALGVDRDRIVVCGSSAGGGLAAGTALLLRDRGGPTLLGEVLLCPMLDDRNDGASVRQFAENAFWDRRSNETGWAALLGTRAGGDAVNEYAAPARATDLAGLPPAYLDVGSTELFRDEVIRYASALCAADVPVELHVWQGGFHEFDVVYPTAEVSVAANATRTSWLRRLLAVNPGPDSRVQLSRESTANSASAG
jgi:acetyl esterase/lipase